MEALLANAILEAMRIYEQSYDRAAADAQFYADNARRTELALKGGVPESVNTDWGKFYTKSVDQAAAEACSSKHINTPALAPLIANMMLSIWNESQEWAQGILLDSN